MPLQDKIDEDKKGFKAKVPKEALAVMHRATKDLAESGILAKTIKVVDMAPDFVFKNTGNQDVSLTELTGRGPVVLSVYRGRWWPYCYMELDALNENVEAISKLGATQVLISPNTIAHNQSIAEDKTGLRPSQRPRQYGSRPLREEVHHVVVIRKASSVQITSE